MKSFAFVELTHAAADADDRAFAFFLEILKKSQSRNRFVNRLLANGAAIDHDEVGVFGTRRLGHSLLGQERGHPLRVRHVHLAAKRLESGTSAFPLDGLGPAGPAMYLCPYAS